MVQTPHHFVNPKLAPDPCEIMEPFTLSTVEIDGRLMASRIVCDESVVFVQAIIDWAMYPAYTH
jgi:hypothetical protein